MSQLSSKGLLVVWSMWMMTFVTFIFVCLRLYTRAFILRGLGLDDYLTNMCWVLNLMFSIMSTIAATHGMGRHLAELTLDQTVQTLKYITIAQTVGILVAGTVKIVLGLFLLRIVVNRWQRIVLWIPMAAAGILCIITVMGLWLQKTPVESIFNPTIPGKVHLNQTKLSLVYSSVLIVTDFFYALFPWLFMWKLRIGKKEKTIILCGLSLGIIAGICGIIRTIKLVQLDSVDFSYAIVEPIIWTAGEFCVTLTCNSVLALYPLYKRIFLHGASSGGGYRSQLGDGPYGEQSSHHMNWIRKGGGSSNDANTISGAYPLGNPDKNLVITTTTTIVRPTRNASDDSILGSIKAEHDGIRRTHEVKVEYGDESSSRRSG